MVELRSVVGVGRYSSGGAAAGPYQQLGSRAEGAEQGASWREGDHIDGRWSASGQSEASSSGGGSKGIVRVC
jgi:hypothetical protein